MRVMILDTETTGIDPTTHRVIEIGAVVYDFKEVATVEERSELVQSHDNPAQHVNHVPVGLLHSARSRADVVAWVVEMASRHNVVAVMAHSAASDRQWLPELHHLPWVCTKDHVEWPHAKAGGRLCSLVADEGAAWSRWHRALSDCLAIAAVLDRCAERGVDLVDLVTRAMEPRKLYKAIVSYEDRDQAKAAGFWWDGQTKRWLREMSERQAAACPVEAVAVAK